MTHKHTAIKMLTCKLKRAGHAVASVLESVKRHVTILHITLLSDKCFGQIMRTRKYRDSILSSDGNKSAEFLLVLVRAEDTNVIRVGHEMSRQLFIFVTRARRLQWEGK